MDASSSKYLMTEIRGLRLAEFDWDGCGGLPLRSDVADTIADIYDSPFGEASLLSGLPYPVVSMNGDGTIDAEYGDDGGRQLFLTFKSLGVVTYIRVFEDDQTTIEGTVRIPEYEDDPSVFAELADLFDWLSSE